MAVTPEPARRRVTGARPTGEHAAHDGPERGEEVGGVVGGGCRHTVMVEELAVARDEPGGDLAPADVDSQADVHEVRR